MKTVFTFHATIEVVEIGSLPPSFSDYYVQKHPEATHLVMSPTSHVVYAIAGSEQDAREALRKMEEVTVR